ncbi:ATP-dependent DNA ligase [Paenibacillus eucommiae]|uniref:DNA ligase-1 n=1 Tax=Paenibacillus eucommiae TaxID=1355755 RepID=A0ABS4J5U1_9BACL|nr:ATP-dependent DNA ligase [Paenibacillus eucommiae]MBP1995214.1 DNA ligase-1 [Paenibacillus eucommiae]
MLLISPMLLETTKEPFDSVEYIYEPKIDGRRLLIFKNNRETRIFTRHGNEVTRLYPELWNVPIDGDVILDGEGTVIDPETGDINSEHMQERSKITKKARIKAAMVHQPVTFFCFDILRYNNRDLRGLPLIKRKSILESVFTSSPRYSDVTYVEEHGNDLYKTICDKNMEGIIAKRKNSVYVSGKSNAWQKIINRTYADDNIKG